MEFFTSTFNNTPVMYAASSGYEEILELLLRQKGININTQGILNLKAFIEFKSNFFSNYIENLNCFIKFFSNIEIGQR